MRVKLIKAAVGLTALILGSISVHAQAESSDLIIVTATGQPQPRNESGQAISVIDAQRIEQIQTRTVADLLASLPSVRMNRNGGLGAVTNVSIRGADSGQTVVLLDGVRINDPSSPNGATDFGNLMVGNIRHVELMRGANGIAYGSDAIGGVIDLSTRDESARDGLSLRGSAEGGYARTAQGALDLGWRDGESYFDVGVQGLRSDGISALSARRHGSSEPDGLDNVGAHVRFEAPVSDGVSIDLHGYFIGSGLDFDSWFDSPDHSEFRQFTTYSGLRSVSFSGALDQHVSLTYMANRRDYRTYYPVDPPALPPPDIFGYRGSGWRLDYQGKVILGHAARLLFGYSHDASDYRFFGFGSDESHDAATDSGFALLSLKPLVRLSLSAGLRHDIHRAFGGVTTLGANANWGLANGRTHIRAAYGDGFKAPSLYQLYDHYSGNRTLQPERSHNFDLGLDHHFLDGRAQLSLTVFSRVTRNEIGYDFGIFAYRNEVRTSAYGVELELILRPLKGLDLAASYDLLDTRNRTPGSVTYNMHMERRPVHSLSLSADRKWSFGLATGATLRLVSDAVEHGSPTDRLAGYALLDLRASLPLTAHLEAYGRLENAFNAFYETAYGYSTYGRAAYLGVRVKL